MNQNKPDKGARPVFIRFSIPLSIPADSLCFCFIDDKIVPAAFFLSSLTFRSLNDSVSGRRICMHFRKTAAPLRNTFYIRLGIGVTFEGMFMFFEAAVSMADKTVIRMFMFGDAAAENRKILLYNTLLNVCVLPIRRNFWLPGSLREESAHKLCRIPRCRKAF